MDKIGILHPGEMGVSIAASAINSGHQVYWSSEGRSAKTRARAEEHALTEVGTLAELCRACTVMVSVCPPHAAEDTARMVSETGFTGLYLDANAISPQRAIRIAESLKARGIPFVDGGIIGGPAWKPNETWLYLSGERAEEAASFFSGGPLETRILAPAIGKASALKMCYAAYTKGATALLAAILAAAERLDVREALDQQWDMDEAESSQQVKRRVSRVTAKAWRFEGEMREIASTFREAGLPDGFHRAAAEIYQRLADFKDSGDPPPLDDVLRSLLVEKSDRPA